jgi:hypothetical protein
VRVSKTVRLFVLSFCVVLAAGFANSGIFSTGESFAQDLPHSLSSKKKAKPKPPVLKTSVLYPSDGVLSPDEPQIVQIGVTVQPSPGTPLNQYVLLLNVLKHNGPKVLSDPVHPT